MISLGGNDMDEITSIKRVINTLQFIEGDRIPFFLFPTIHGASEIGLNIKEYFSIPECVVEGQLRMQKKYGHDCVYTYLYAPLMVEAFGGEVIYYDDAPPNSGEPFIKKIDDISKLQIPNIYNTKCLNKVLKITEQLKAKTKGKIPVIGTIFSPFSLPAMQLGLHNYIELIYERPDLFEKLMKINEEFCVEWANAQIAAGADIIVCLDPMACKSIIPKEHYIGKGFKIVQRTINRIKGFTVIHFASSPCLHILDDVIKIGTNAVGASSLEDIGEIKAIASKGKLSIIGNLDVIKMSHWSKEDIKMHVKDIIAKAGKGGGLIIAPSHGDIPLQVPGDTLLNISEAVLKWGKYPLDWVK